jgi:hypothetical protein
MASVRGTSYETTILVRDSCLCLHVQRAARALARRFDNALRPLGLTNGQFSLMMSLNRPEGAHNWGSGIIAGDGSDNFDRCREAAATPQSDQDHD